MSIHPAVAASPAAELALLKPYPGQPDAEVARWFQLKYPSGLTKRSPGAYCAELYKTQPNKSDYGAADWEIVYAEWYGALTDRQKKIMAQAKRIRTTDPEKIAAAKAKRAKDPEYQKELLEKRQAYAASKGAPVRTYRKGVTEDQKRADRKSRNDEARERIRSQIANGRNPFAEDTGFRWLIVNELLTVGSFEMAAPEYADHEAEIKSAYETLRVAKAVKRNGSILTIRPELVEISEAEAFKDDPTYGLV